MDWSLSSLTVEHKYLNQRMRIEGYLCTITFSKYDRLDYLHSRVQKLQVHFPENTRYGQETIDILAKTLIKSLELRELELHCRNQVPAPLCRAIALNQSIRSLSLVLAHRIGRPTRDARFTHYTPSSDLVDAIETNSTIESLYLVGNVNKMASSVARLLSHNRLCSLEIVHATDQVDFQNRFEQGAVDTEQMDLLIHTIGSCRSLKNVVLRQRFGQSRLNDTVPIHYTSRQLANLLRSPSLESLWLRDMKLCGRSSGDEVYAALSSNRRLRNLDLWSSTKIVQDPKIEALLQRQVEAALRDHSTTLIRINFATFDTLRTTECMQYWLDLNAAGRALVRTSDDVDKLLPHILARVSHKPNQLYGLLRESIECLCRGHH